MHDAPELARQLGIDATLVFCVILVGFAFLVVLWVLNTVFSIIAAIKASDGEFYRYPMTIRLIQ